MATMLAMGFAATAGEKEHANGIAAADQVEKNIVEVGRPVMAEGQAHCSFTAKGSVNALGISLDFACTATEETCKQAIEKAMECAKLTVRIVRDQFSK